MTASGDDVRAGPLGRKLAEPRHEVSEGGRGPALEAIKLGFADFVEQLCHFRAVVMERLAVFRVLVIFVTMVVVGLKPSAFMSVHEANYYVSAN